MNVHLKTTFVKIRKPRRCFACLTKFEKGQKMVNNVTVFDGDFGSEYYCECCWSFILKYIEPEDGIGEGDFAGQDEYEKFHSEFNASKQTSKPDTPHQSQ